MKDLLRTNKVQQRIIKDNNTKKGIVIVKKTNIGLLLVLGAGTMATVQAGEIKRDLLQRPRISADQAKQIALKQVENGKVEDMELETENGRKVWSFDIETPGTKNITEVQIDANSGAVVSKKVETEADEEKEKKEDSKG